MFEQVTIEAGSKPAFYDALAGQLRGLLGGERDWVANAANTAALIYGQIPDLNWAGFYLLRDPRELVLGPFQGQPACIRIALGKGVCGTAAAQRRAVRVDDVHAFPGHIACDAASRSELVVPLLRGGALLGVLDLDSPSPARFDADDEAGIAALAAIFVEGSDIDAAALRGAHR